MKVLPALGYWQSGPMPAHRWIENEYTEASSCLSLTMLLIERQDKGKLMIRQGRKVGNDFAILEQRNKPSHGSTASESIK